MASKLENNEDESFIILGSSPGTSLDFKCNGVGNEALITTAQIEDAMKDLSMEASDSYKAHFNLADCPSPASMMVASNIITEDKSTEELQKRFGEILDENIILKDTLKQNNDSLKEQFLLIASCQDDMLKTSMQHKEKFEETKLLIEKLRQENKKLKLDIVQLSESPSSLVNGETGEVKSDPASCPKSGPSSALEFVTSPEDDTVDKLTAQLELVEKQRRQVITDNEKLTWQKESLEHIVDATTKERDDLKEKLKNVELQLSSQITKHETQLRELNFTIQEQQNKLDVLSVTPEDITRRDAIIRHLEDKCTALMTELKNAKLDILKSQNFKMKYADQKSSMQEVLKIQKESLHEMNVRLKRATNTRFQQVCLPTSPNYSLSFSEFGDFASNVNLYDMTLKHLAELLNQLTHGLSDSLMETLGVIVSLHDYKLEKITEAQFKSGLATVKRQLESQQCDALDNIGQVRGTLMIFQGIFADYKDFLKIKIDEDRPRGNIEELTAALVARGLELQIMEAELNKLRSDKEDIDHLKAQLDLYRSDFEAEREAREKMASEKDKLELNLRQCHRRNAEITHQLEEVERVNPGIYRHVTTISYPSMPLKDTPAIPPNHVHGNAVFTCPKCMRFTSRQMRVMEDHLDFCLDDF